ncbi:electron transfer flavoprotein regulatory factor 1 isoform X2 [Petromyzon marinus]
MSNSLRHEVIQLYKQLLHLGREYPKGAAYFRDRLKRSFQRNADERDPEKIRALLERGRYVGRELEALYHVRKYRALKRRYYYDDTRVGGVGGGVGGGAGGTGGHGTSDQD